MVELCTLEERLAIQLRTESATDVENWDTIKSENKKTNLASIQSFVSVNDDHKTSLAILSSAPRCLKPTVVTGFLQNVKLDCLLDSGTRENFINKKIVNELRRKIFSAKMNVSMASQAFSVKVLGEVKGT